MVRSQNGEAETKRVKSGGVVVQAGSVVIFDFLQCFPNRPIVKRTP